ncbi:MAG: transporter substrate-binding domain-containing protein [Thermodesulfobacteriota bacterium]
MLASHRARLRFALSALVLSLAATACSTPAQRPSAPPRTPTAPELRVGVTLDTPPFAMQQGTQMAGIEVDFAMKIAATLRRPLRVVALSWNELIPALTDGQIDIIMSGMTITRLRTLRVAFSQPYMDSGMSVLLRAGLADSYPTPQSVMTSSLRIGVTRGTTAETYVRENYRTGQIFPYLSNSDAVADLVPGRVDAFVSDAPIVAWFASEHEGQLVPLIRPFLTSEQLGWGFRPQDTELRSQVDDMLAGWKADGTVTAVIRRWLPMWQPR